MGKPTYEVELTCMYRDWWRGEAKSPEDAKEKAMRHVGTAIRAEHVRLVETSPHQSAPTINDNVEAKTEEKAADFAPAPRHQDERLDLAAPEVA